MHFFDHFGHLAHGHSGAFVAVAIAVLVAIALPLVFAARGGKDTDS